MELLDGTEAIYYRYKMSIAASRIRDLARQLVDHETGCDNESSDGRFGPISACAKLRVHLAKLAGETGFQSLMSRALALAQAETPNLNLVTVLPDGSLDGFRGGTEDGSAGVVLVTQLLGLLITFIGEPLTLSLVRDAWPDVPLTGFHSGSEEEL